MDADYNSKPFVLNNMEILANNIFIKVFIAFNIFIASIFSVFASVTVTVVGSDLQVSFPYSTSSLDTYNYHSSYITSSSSFNSGGILYTSLINSGANGHYTTYISAPIVACNASTTYMDCDLGSFNSFEYWMATGSVFLSDPALNSTSTFSTSTPDFSSIRPIDILVINSVIITFILLFWSFVVFYDYKRKK